MGFPRQEYWSRLPVPPPGDLPHPGIKPASHMSPALAGGFLLLCHLGSTHICCQEGNKSFSDLKLMSMLLDTLYREVIDGALI